MRFTVTAVLFGLFTFGSAMFAQGLQNLSRDYLLHYDPKHYGTNTELFCSSFRKQCIDYVGPLGQHHQLDAVIAQANPLWAFCGGIAKSPDGDWAVGEVVIDHTEAILKASHATLVKTPLGRAGCLKFKKKHPTVIC